MNMKHTCINHLTEAVIRSVAVHLLKIDGFSVTKATMGNSTDFVKSRCSVDDYDWEIRLYPARYLIGRSIYVAALEFVFLGGARTHSVTADLSIRLVDYQSCGVNPIPASMPVSKTFKDPSDVSYLAKIGTGLARDVPVPASLTVECTISVLREPKAICRPSSDLHQHLGELLQSQAGADVTFAVSGESIAAHKSILAARSPVFMAEFFGSMVERSSQRVEIQDMDAEVFKAMLRFIYTDMVPEFDEQPEATAETTVMDQHLLVAADRYGLDRLKVICAGRLSLGINVGTVASTLALAEQHNCSQLKAKCIEFISGGTSENLCAVLATKGYRHLEASNPSVLTELLKAAHGRKS